MTPQRVLTSLVVGTLLARLAWGSVLGPGPDEAYYWLFTIHPDWSYYDHPPMLALLGRLGLGISGRLVSPGLALRLGFIVLFAGSTLLMARLTGRMFGPRAGACGAIILNATAYYGAAAGTFALPDGPLVFFWLLTLDRQLNALERPERIGPWLGVGLAWGGALLSKYHAVFLPAGLLLYLAWDRHARRCLRTPGPYLAVVVGLLAFSPVIAWNAVHGWGSFAFQAGRASSEGGFRPERVVGFLGGQAAYLLPWMWLFLLGSAWRRRPGKPIRPGEKLLLCQSVAPLGVFSVVSCTRPTLPHWSLVGFLSLMPLLGADWAAWWAIEPRRVGRRLAVVALVPLLGMAAFLMQERLGLIPARYDPLADLSGWDQVATALRRRGLLDPPGSFVFTSRWFDSGQLAYALGPSVPVLCYNARDAHGFAHWSRPEDWVNRTGILVVARESSTEPQAYDRWFERIEPVGRVEVLRRGRPLRVVYLYRCIRQRRPFPFDGRAAILARATDGAGRRR
jgi:hypothetical protein